MLVMIYNRKLTLRNIHLDNLIQLIPQIKNFLPIVGSFQIENFRTNLLQGGQAKGPNDFVSNIDIESEKLIKTELEIIFPKAGFFGEETGMTKMQEWMWVVDPIDGTSNYLSGIDQFSISIALSFQNKPVLGVVYKPMTKECFWSVKSQGFYHDEKRIIPHNNFLLKDAIIGTGFPFRNYDTVDYFNGTVKDLLAKSRGIRRMGSAALDLAYTACGYFQGFWEIGLQPYDVAAGLLFLEETNCICTNFNGNTYQLFDDKSIVCGLPKTYEDLLKIVQNNYRIHSA